MQSKKAKYHLKRIDTILNLHEDSLSTLDRDILLEDIRQLYDLVVHANDDHIVNPSFPPRDHTYVARKEPVNDNIPRQQNTPISRNDQNESASSENKLEMDLSTPDETSQPSSANTQPEIPVHTPTTITYEESTEEVRHYVAEPPIPHSSAPNSMNGVNEKPVSAPLQDDHDETMVQDDIGYPELFDFSASSELSDRLANSKIDHLNRILTINDKILFINHLFGGEAIPFQDCLKKLESFYTYDEAKQYASRELVTNYHWTNQEKYDTVRQFMRQVKRLYN